MSPRQNSCQECAGTPQVPCTAVRSGAGTPQVPCTAVRSDAGTPQVPCTAVRSGTVIGLLSSFDSVFARVSLKETFLEKCRDQNSTRVLRKKGFVRSHSNHGPPI